VQYEESFMTLGLLAKYARREEVEPNDLFACIVLVNIDLMIQGRRETHFLGKTTFLSNRQQSASVCTARFSAMTEQIVAYKKADLLVVLA
jgi:hypothetical protein